MRKFMQKLFNRSQAAADAVELTRMARRFTVEQQQVPKVLEDLVALRYLERIPEAPQGLRFVLDRKKVEVRVEAQACALVRSGLKKATTTSQGA